MSDRGFEHRKHQVISLGIAAAEQGLRVKHALARKLANMLVEAADECQLAQTIARYGSVVLLAWTIAGLHGAGSTWPRMLARVFTEWEEAASVAIAKRPGLWSTLSSYTRSDTRDATRPFPPTVWKAAG
jgi:hypothetical protein